MGQYWLCSKVRKPSSTGGSLGQSFGRSLSWKRRQWRPRRSLKRRIVECETLASRVIWRKLEHAIRRWKTGSRDSGRLSQWPTEKDGDEKYRWQCKH